MPHIYVAKDLHGQRRTLAGRPTVGVQVSGEERVAEEKHCGVDILDVRLLR